MEQFYAELGSAVALVFLAGMLVRTAAGESLTYVDLVGRLTDLERLATLPTAGEKCAQWSSYDRQSRYDEKTGKYLDWAANDDAGGIIREEGGKAVLAEMDGPGCIWRIWSAAPKEGKVSIYLDGNEPPAVDLPFAGYFDRENAPFTRPNLVYEAAKGRNCYVPIPYQKSCKIVADRDWGGYYHFTYSTFPKGTKLPTFNRDLTGEESAALDDADRILAGCGSDPAGKRPGEAVVKVEVRIPAGRTVKVAELAGPRAITAIRVKPDLPKPPADRTALRELALQITWDDAAEPAVWSPLGDFFGAAPGVNRYRSLPVGMTEEGLYSFWYMPFATSARVEVVNDGGMDRLVAFEVTHAPLAKPVERFGRFHAKWHRDAMLPAETERKIDWTMLGTAGRGRYCGVTLHVWNPEGEWWGEGDEKFFVDGEKFPSTFGTGSEDYFGYAWGHASYFQRPFHSQPLNKENRGHVSNNRWHVVDNVPFQQSFEGCIEKYFPNDRPTLYACVAYWYLGSGGSDPYGTVSIAERIGYFPSK